METFPTDIKKACSSVASYLLRHGCTNVRYSGDREHSEHMISVTLHNRQCQLWIQKAWMRHRARASVAERLDRLEVIRFMQHNSFAWVGLKADKDVIQHIPKRKSANPRRQHKGIALTLKHLLHSRTPITDGRTPVGTLHADGATPAKAFNPGQSI